MTTTRATFSSKDKNHDDYETKRNGGLAKPNPYDDDSPLLSSWIAKLSHFLLVYVVFQMGFPIFIFLRITSLSKETKNKKNKYQLGDVIFIMKKCWHFLHGSFQLTRKAHRDPVTLTPDDVYINEVWELDSARHYLRKTKDELPLEWQIREGYCGPTTLRCILKSYSSYPIQFLSEPASGASDPESFVQKIEENLKIMTKKKSNGDDIGRRTPVPTFHTEIVRPIADDNDGDGVDYDRFLSKLRTALSSNNCRVGVNYLRGALMGITKSPSWIPVHCFMSMFVGHFSPILGILEEDIPLVAVFDVNSTYGMYLVEASLLYEAMKGKDLSTGKSRGIVIISEGQQHSK